MDVKERAIEAIEDYPDMSKKIHEREQEILYPYQAFDDDNIGGGRAQGVRDESTEKTVQKLIDDPILKEYHRKQDAVEKVLRRCITKQVRSLLDNATYDIIYEFYFRDTQIYTAEGIAQKVNLSKRSVYARRNAFIEAVAKELD